MRSSAILLLLLASSLALLAEPLLAATPRDMALPLTLVAGRVLHPHLQPSPFVSPAHGQTCPPTNPKNSSSSLPPALSSTLHFHPDARPRPKHGAAPPLWTRRPFAGISRKRRRSRKSEPRRPGKVHVAPIAFTDAERCVGHEVGFAGRGFSRVTVCGGGGSGSGGAGEPPSADKAQVYQDIERGCVVYRYPMPLGGVMESRRCVSRQHG